MLLVFSGSSELGEVEQLADADGGDQQDQPRRAAQPADDDQLDEAAEDRAESDHERERRPEGQPMSTSLASTARTEGADLAVGEVDDARGPVDQHQAGGEQRVDRAR